MTCPRCGFSEPGPVECPRCGVVFAKLDRSPRPPATRPDAPPSPSWGRPFTWFDATLVLALAGAVATLLLRWEPPVPPAAPEPVAIPGSGRPAGVAPTPRSPGPPRSSPAPRALAGPDAAPARSEALPPRPAPPPTIAGPLPAAIPAPPHGLGPEDADVFVVLSLRLERRQPIESSHVGQAEALHARYPQLGDAGRLLQRVLSGAARQARERGRPATELRYLARATEAFPERRVVWVTLVEAHEHTRAWSDAERVARRGLSALPDESWLYLALARALGRQGRDAEAADVLRRRLVLRPGDEAARRELARLEKSLQSVAGLAQRTSPHFSVRFEGEADDALGEALLEVLEEKYGMLEGILDCAPEREIPVILLPRQTFRSVSTAPDWAGGYFSRSDTRIRIGTRNLSPGFVPLDLERTLTHELAHAFIYARTGGAVPDDINEGLAQYLSGKRLGYRLDPRRAEARDGRMQVDDFYDSALSFVEYLIDRHRQQTLNELLRYAGETGSVDQAFRRVFHRTYDETREEWLKSLR